MLLLPGPILAISDKYFIVLILFMKHLHTPVNVTVVNCFIFISLQHLCKYNT